MSHCHDEHVAHGGHDHGGHNHDHNHDHSDDLTPARQRSLYDRIEFDGIVTLNEHQRGSGKAIVKKTWAQRMLPEPELKSDTDEQIIMHIPFAGQIKLHSIELRTSQNTCAPRTLRVFINRDDIDFDNADDLKPTQEFHLSQTSEILEIPVKRALFGSVHRLTLYFVNNFSTRHSDSNSDLYDDDEDDDDADVTRLSYLGFRGEWMQRGRAPAQILYEAAPNPNDHTIKGTNVNAMSGDHRTRGPSATSSLTSPWLPWPLPSSAVMSAVLSPSLLPAKMAPRLPARWAAALTAGPTSLTSRILTTPNRTLLPRTARRGVKYGWSTAPPRNKPARFNQVSAGLPAPTTGPAAALARKAQSTPVRAGLMAVKKGVSAMYDTKKGTRTPCTILQIEQCQVVACKTREKNGYWAVQVGCGAKTPGNTTAPLLGYYEGKGIAPKRHLAEFKVRGEEGLLPVGVQLLPDWFKVGQFVDARSNSRGMGFAGGMKRHGFAGQEASHGNSKNHRTIGTTGPGQGGGSRVHPGKKMPGRMGNERVTVQNLRVLKVDNKLGVVVVKGHVAGPKGCLVKIADAIKKDPPVETFIEKTKRLVLERNEGHEDRLEQARIAHMDFKEMRKQLQLSS
ncbi:translation protein [Xylaria palmicola]|nr:translation protein [Xylaria palmicola]